MLASSSTMEYDSSLNSEASIGEAMAMPADNEMSMHKISLVFLFVAYHLYRLFLGIGCF